MNENQNSPQIANKGCNGDSAFHTVLDFTRGSDEKNRYVKHTVANGMAIARSVMLDKNWKNWK